MSKIIIGVDPGTAATGFGIISSGSNLDCIQYGVIQTSASLPQAVRLKKISAALEKLIKKYRPEILAVENVFFFKNLKTAMPVSQAKGVILLAAAKNRIDIKEFSPPQVKIAVTGYGKAEKKQVQKMVQAILRLKQIPKPDDAADALAIAICCAHYSSKVLTGYCQRLQ